MFVKDPLVEDISFGQKIIRRFKCKYLSKDLPEANL